MSAPVPVTRPDGRVYRPRKGPVLVPLGWDGEEAVVLRTHDVQVAADLIDRFGGTDAAAYRYEPGWCFTSPGSDGGDFVRMYNTGSGTESRSVPCVWVK